MSSPLFSNSVSANYSSNNLEQLRLLPNAIQQLIPQNPNLSWDQKEAPIWPYIPIKEECRKLSQEQIDSEINLKRTIQIKDAIYVISKLKENESFVAYRIHSEGMLKFSTISNGRIQHASVPAHEYVIVRPSHLVKPKYKSLALRKLAQFFKTLGEEQGSPIMARPDTFYDPVNPNNGGFSIVPRAIIQNINH